MEAQTTYDISVCFFFFRLSSRLQKLSDHSTAKQLFQLLQLLSSAVAQIRLPEQRKLSNVQMSKRSTLHVKETSYYTAYWFILTKTQIIIPARAAHEKHNTRRGHNSKIDKSDK